MFFVFPPMLAKMNRFWIMFSLIIFVILENFSTYIHSNDLVLMENDQPYKIMGVESMMIQMFDEKVCRLINMRHILDMCKKLISLDELEPKRFKWHIVDDVLSI